MGTFEVALGIGDRQGQGWETQGALVDTVVSYTWAPRDVLERLGVQAEIRLEFETADGRVVERDAGETRARLNGQQRTTLVVFGDEGSKSMLGAYTLEGFGLPPDPVNRRLIKVRPLAM